MSDTAHADQHASRQNVSSTERTVSLIGAALLAADGLRRGNALGIVELAGAAFLGYRGATGHCNVYEAIGVNSRDGQGLLSGQWTEVRDSVLVSRPAEQLYAEWRKLDNLPQILSNVTEVKVLDDRRSEWTVKGPLGVPVSWETHITDDRPNERIAWRAVAKAAVANEGVVMFESRGPDQTQLTAVIRYKPPLGKAGQAVASLLGREPGQELRQDLRNFKQRMEGGAAGAQQGGAVAGQAYAGDGLGAGARTVP